MASVKFVDSSISRFEKRFAGSSQMRAVNAAPPGAAVMKSSMLVV
jgi:hypothetical protein